MTQFNDYSHKYKHIKMDCEEGILQLTLHTDGKALVWGAGPHEEFCHAFRGIGGER